MPLATFTRPSVAYDPVSGVQVANNVARFTSVPRNLLTPNQASVETDTTGFTVNGSGTAFSRDTATAWQGNASLKVVGSGSVASQGVIASTTAAASTTYTGSLWIKGSGTVKFGFNGAALTAGTYSNPMTLTSDWTRYSITVTTNATGGAINFLVFTDVAQATTFWVDGLQVEVGPLTPWVLPGTSYGLLVESQRGNLLTANQSSVETDTTGFSVTGAVTIARTTAWAWTGIASLSVSGANDMGTQRLLISTQSLTAGTAYTAFGYVYNPTASSITVSISLAGATISSVTIAPGQVKRVSNTWTPSATASQSIRMTEATGANFYVDGLQIEAGAYPTSWILGGSTRSPDSAAKALPKALPPAVVQSVRLVAEWGTGQPVSNHYLHNLYLDANNRQQIYYVASTSTITASRVVGGTVYSAVTAPLSFPAGTDLRAAVGDVGGAMTLQVFGLKPDGTTFTATASAASVQPLPACATVYTGCSFNTGFEANAYILWESVRIADASVTSTSLATIAASVTPPQTDHNTIIQVDYSKQSLEGVPKPVARITNQKKLQIAGQMVEVLPAALSFTRPSVAYNPVNGTQIATGVPRFPMGRFGPFGGAIHFDGASGYVDCGNPSAIRITGSAVTLEAWIYPRNVSGKTNTIISKTDGGAFALHINFSSDQSIDFYVHTNGTYKVAQVAISGNLFNNQWQHVAGVYDGTNSYIYINGALKATLPCTGNITDTAGTNLMIGAEPSGSNPTPPDYFDGWISNVRAWNVGRTQAQVQADMYSFQTMKNASGLVGWWKMLETSGTSVADSSGNNLSATAKGTFWWDGVPDNGFFPEESTTNLLTANQSSVETDTTGWTAYLGKAGVTLTRDTSTFWQGSASLKVVTDGSVVNQGAHAGFVAVTAGSVYSVSLYANAASSVSLCPTVAWYDSAGAFLSSTQGTAVPMTGGWVRITLTGTAPTNAARLYGGAVTNGSVAATMWIDGLQLEQKAYATSWTLGGTTRNAETLTLPISGLLSPTAFTLGVWVYVNSAVRRLGANNTMLNVNRANPADYAILLYHASGTPEWKLTTKDDSGVSSTVTIADSLTPDGWHHFVIRGNSSGAQLSLNGVPYGTTNKMATGFHTTAYVGVWGNTAWLNAFFDDLRISNVYRTDAEVLSLYQSTVATKADGYTTLYAPFDGSLNTQIGYKVSLNSSGDLKIQGTALETPGQFSLYGTTFSVDEIIEGVTL